MSRARPSAEPALPPGLGRSRRLARLFLWWEAVWPRAWPALGVAGLFLVAALSGLFLVLPLAAHVALLAGFAGALLLAGWRGARGFAPPDAAAADRRIEAASGLGHRPLAALADRPVADDPASRALWRAHLAREAARLRNLRAGPPRPGLPKRDARALRLGLVVALAAAGMVAGGEAAERLRRALLPALAAAPRAPELRLEAWVTPPAYTGAAPVFLSAAGGAASVPAGSVLRASLSGGAGGVPDLLLGGAATPFRALDGAAGGAGSYGVESVLDAGGSLSIRRDGREVAAWSLTVRADSPPTAEFSEPPGPAPRGLAVRLPWRAADDWGVHGARAEIRLAVRPDAPPLVLELPLPGGVARAARGTAQPDLSAHPWAGLPVTVRLVARDGANQEGTSEPAPLNLPERSFEHPVARALVALRRALSLNPEARVPARAELDRIAAAPDAFEHDASVFLALRVARYRLLRDRPPTAASDAGPTRAVRQDPAAVPEAQAILWDVALALEEGRTDRTARALAEARQALREALENRDAADRPNGERQAEIERRIQELREAINRHLEALAERLQRENAEAMPRDPSSRMLDQRELDRRAERMREAAREGRDEDARRELAEMEEMLRALEEGRVARAGENERRQQNRERGQGQMGALQDMVRRQSEALDRSHQRAESAEGERGGRERRPQSRAGRDAPPQPPREGGQPSREEQADARTQRALRRALGELMQQFGDLTGEVPEQLGRADQAMRDGAEALARGGDARPAQERALRELAEGGRQMARSMQRQFGRGQEGEEDGEGEGEGEGNGSAAENGPRGGQGRDSAGSLGPGRDPLGRRAREAAGSAEEGGDTRVPDEAEQLRTRRIQEELRRRVGERERPPQELDYLDRLLRRF